MFSERLAKLRKSKKLSQYELAERLNYSRGQLSNYEQGSREPDYSTLCKIANFFGVSVDYLIGHSDEIILSKEDQFIQDNVFSLEELRKKYNVTLDGKETTDEELKNAIALIRSLRLMK